MYTNAYFKFGSNNHILGEKNPWKNYLEIRYSFWDISSQSVRQNYKLAYFLTTCLRFDKMSLFSYFQTSGFYLVTGPELTV